jgi:dynactin complex subunit
LKTNNVNDRLEKLQAHLQTLQYSRINNNVNDRLEKLQERLQALQHNRVNNDVEKFVNRRTIKYHPDGTSEQIVEVLNDEKCCVAQALAKSRNRARLPTI